VRAGCNVGADLAQVLGHRLGIDCGHDDGSADAACRADGTEQVSFNCRSQPPIVFSCTRTSKRRST
jgi:hypothetical protein